MGVSSVGYAAIKVSAFRRLATVGIQTVIKNKADAYLAGHQMA
jgi:hypothetical protein